MYRALASPVHIGRNIAKAGNIYTYSRKVPNFSKRYKELLLFIMFVSYAELYKCKDNIISVILNVCFILQIYDK